MNTPDINAVNTVPLAAAHRVATALDAGSASNRAAKAIEQGVATTATAKSSSATATDPSTITSSDFLTLLVSELQNQDPTAPTDPNAYITQLVGVNSLQQLISIDQGITALQPTTTSSTGKISTTSADGI